MTCLLLTLLLTTPLVRAQQEQQATPTFSSNVKVVNVLA
jgi:hypothetical protein